MTSNKTQYTAAEALKCLDGVSKKRLYEMMKKGDLSYTNEQYGSTSRRILDGSELARVFEDDFNPNGLEETTQETVLDTIQKPLETSETLIKNSALEQKVELLEQQLASKNEMMREIERARNTAETLAADLSKKVDNIVESMSGEKTLLIEDHRQREEELQNSLEEKDAALKAAEEAAEKKRGLFGWLRA